MMLSIANKVCAELEHDLNLEIQEVNAPITNAKFEKLRNDEGLTVADEALQMFNWACGLEVELEKANTQNKRLLSLVRLQRVELHEQDAITDEEYADLAGQSDLRVTLETHDELRAKLAVANEQLRAANELIEFAGHWLAKNKGVQQP